MANFTNHTLLRSLGADPTTPVLDTGHDPMPTASSRSTKGFPSGELRTVDGSALDFRAARSVAAVFAEDEQVRRANGFDHHFVLKRQGTAERLRIRRAHHHPASGRQLEVWSSEPGMQFFTGNNLAGKLLGRHEQGRQDFCLPRWLLHGTVAFPGFAKSPELPSTSVKPGEFYTGHRVSILDVSRLIRRQDANSRNKRIPAPRRMVRGGDVRVGS